MSLISLNFVRFLILFKLWIFRFREKTLLASISLALNSTAESFVCLSLSGPEELFLELERGGKPEQCDGAKEKGQRTLKVKH